MIKKTLQLLNPRCYLLLNLQKILLMVGMWNKHALIIKWAIFLLDRRGGDLGLKNSNLKKALLCKWA